MVDAKALSGSKLKEVLLGVAGAAGVDTAGVEQQVTAVMQGHMKFLPVRHHSPASAWLVKEAIDTWKPKLVLIEGPSCADSLIQYMVMDDTVPPFAILSMFSDDTNHFGMNGVLPFSPDPSIPARFQVQFPFISYSPELVALVEAKRLKIPAHFIDLPLTGLIPFMINFKDKIEYFLKHEEDLMFSNAFFEKLVEVFGFDDFNEVWDTLFEIGVHQLGIDQVRENMLFFCSCVRKSIDPESLKLDGTFAREQYMRCCIDQHRARYQVPEEGVLVITGGLHSIALPGTIPAQPSLPGTGFLNSLVPFSYFRISDKSGYGSGNQGPLYYEHAWQQLVACDEKPYETIALDFITNILGDARNKEETISVSDSINAFHGAKMLAMLRRRHEPCMKDVVDSIYMALVKGDPAVEGAYLQPIIRDRLVGHKVGKITSKMGRLPLQEDFYLRFEAFGIQLSEKVEMFSLDLRNVPDVARSVLFWRVSYLGVGVLDRTGGPDLLKGITGVFTETWVFRWHPGVDMKLIELNIYGSTVEEASKNMMLEELKKSINNYDRVSNLLYHSIVMGFTVEFNSIHQSCMDSLDHDDNFINLSSGFMNVVMIYHLLKAMPNQENNLVRVETLLVRNHFATCFALPNMANPKDELVDPVVSAVKKVATVLLTFTGVDLDRQAFIGSLNTCISTTSNEFIKGCYVGILYLMNAIDIHEVRGRIMAYTRSNDSVKVKVGEFIRGIIYECQSQFLFNPEILQLLDEVISAAEWPIFSAILPSLKKSFSDLQPREYEVFAEKLAELYELKATVIKELKDEVHDRHVALFGAINKRVQEIFDDWFGEG
ncbi:MAG: hypothetical protein GYA24_09290 [Candidatus Lokiarchaeota archaeon]|nr:hypothetical protein [Candidatus Lokiarchaeota archaeon]